MQSSCTPTIASSSRSASNSGPKTSIPLWGALLAIFLAGFLPTGVTLVVDTLRLDLSQRRDRRRQREEESLEGTLRRARRLSGRRPVGQGRSGARDLPRRRSPITSPVSCATARSCAISDAPRRRSKCIAALPRTYPRSVSLLYHLAADYRERGDVEIARETESRIVRDFPGFGLEVLRGRRAAALSAREFGSRRGASRAHHRAPERERRLGRAGAGVEPRPGPHLPAGRAPAGGGQVGRGGGSLPQSPRARAEVHTGAHHARRGRAPRGSRGGGDRGLAGRISGDRQPGLPAADRGLLHRAGRADARHRDSARAHRDGADNDLLPRFYLGRLYYRLEMLEEATKQLGAIEERIKSSPTYHFLLGRIHHRRGDFSQGGRVVRRLPATARHRQRRVSLPCLPPALRRLARLLLALRIVERGRSQLRRGTALGGGARCPRGPGLGPGGGFGRVLARDHHGPCGPQSPEK